MTAIARIALFVFLSLAPHAQALTPLIEATFEGDAAQLEPAAASNDPTIASDFGAFIGGTSLLNTAAVVDSGADREVEIWRDSDDPSDPVDVDDAGGPFQRGGNLSLRMFSDQVSRRGGDGTRVYFESSGPATQQGVMSTRLSIPDPSVSADIPLLSLRWGQDANGDQQLASAGLLGSDERIGELTFLANQKIGINGLSGAVSLQTYDFDVPLDLRVEFDPATGGMFSVWLNGTKVTTASNSSGDFAFMDSQASADAIELIVPSQKQASPNGIEVFADDVFLVSGSGGTEYFVDDDPVTGTRDGSSGAPFATVLHGLNALQPGDTLTVRPGVYRERNLFTVTTAKNATPSTRITLRGEPGSDPDQVVITSMVARPASVWSQVSGYDNVWTSKFSTLLHRNVSQGGEPFRLMRDPASGPADDISDPPSPADLIGPDQWTRDTNGNVWVRLESGVSTNPATVGVEVSVSFATLNLSYGQPGGVLDLSLRSDCWTVENLTLEGGYYPLVIKNYYIDIKNVHVRNAFADGIKGDGLESPTAGTAPKMVLIDDVEIYDFGESALDNTGGDAWTIRNTDVYGAVPNREFGYKTNGFMLKNGAEFLLVEHNHFFDMTTKFGAISVGGQSCSAPSVCVPVEARNLVVRHNTITNVTDIGTLGSTNNPVLDRKLIAVQTAYDSTVHDNTVVGSTAEAFVYFAPNEATNGSAIPINNAVLNNNFAGSNSVQYNYLELTTGATMPSTNSTISGNSVATGSNSYFDGTELDQSAMTSAGYTDNYVN